MRASGVRTITIHGTTRMPSRQHASCSLTAAPNSAVSPCRRDRASARRRSRPRSHDAAPAPPRARQAVLEQQRRRAEHRRGVRDAASRDVGRRAVHRLEEPRAAVGEACRRRHPEPAGDRRGEVGEDVAEHVLGDDDVELLWRRRELHRRVVDEHVLDAHAGELRRHLVDDATPHAATSRARSPCRPT